MKAKFFITFLATMLCFNMAMAERSHTDNFYFTQRDKWRFGSKNTMTIMMNIVNYAIKQSRETPQETTQAPAKTQTPKVQAFAGNIYFDEYWTESVYHVYLQAFWDGYRMTSYQQAPECEEDFGTFMDLFHSFHLNMTRRKTNNNIDTWFDPYRLISYTIGNSFNDFWYNCFRCGYDIYDSYKTRFDNFVDFGDVYLSFIFNLLAASVDIKNDVETMIDAFEIHDTEEFVKGLASILRSVLEFESYQTAGSISDNPLELVFVKSVKQPTLHQRKLKIERQMRAAEMRLQEDRAAKKKEILEAANKRIQEEGVHPLVALQPKDYQWSIAEYVEAPFALLIGAMHALPQDSYGYKCSRNTTELRAEVIKGIDFAEKNETISAASSFYDGIALFDEFGIHCMEAFVYDLGTEYWTKLFSVWYGIFENLAYNLGFMWTDVINYIYYTPETVPDNDFGFFTVYLAGDFLMRIFVADRTPHNEDDEEEDD